MRRLGDRRFGVGADQILVVEPQRAPGVDFSYRIFNGGSGDEVEQCGNGARCFVRFVRDSGLTDKRHVARARPMNSVLELRLQDDGRVTVDMGAPVFEPAARAVRRRAASRRAREGDGFALWPLDVGEAATRRGRRAVDGQPARGAARRTTSTRAPVAIASAR